MLSASLRKAFLAAIIICNVLFFWNVEIRGGSVLAFALGNRTVEPAEADETRLTQTRIEQSSAYTFANPARAEHLLH